MPTLIFTAFHMPLLQLLSGLWLAPSIYPGTVEELQRKLDFIKDVMAGMCSPNAHWK